MPKNCKSCDIKSVLTKSISKFGRDTILILGALNQLKKFGIRVIFEQEILEKGYQTTGCARQPKAI